MKYLKSFEKVREMNMLEESIKKGDFTFFDSSDFLEYIENAFKLFSKEYSDEKSEGYELVINSEIREIKSYK